MSKSDAKASKSESGSVPVSKSQRNKAAKLAKAAKSGKVTHHGGVCSSCGQCSTSCTTHTPHDNCIGYVKDYDFKDQALNSLGEVYAMLADGTIIERPIPGKWITAEELGQRRSERAAEAIRLAKNRVVMTSVFESVSLVVPGEKPKFVRLDVTNGLGEPVAYVFGKWMTEAEADAHRLAVLAEVSKMVENDVAEKPILEVAA